MQDIADLRARFESDSVHIRSGAGDLIYVDVCNDLGESTMTLHGAHVMRYAVRGGQPVLWMSAESRFESGKAIRGGVPLCWPWFGAHPEGAPFPAHGYARICEWDLTEIRRLPGGEDQLEFHLRREVVPESLKPLPFLLSYIVTVGSSLTLELTMTNQGELPREISCALHSYFAVSEIGNVEVRGLEKVRYLNALTGVESVDSAPIRVAAETDRIYMETTGAIEIVDSGWERTILLERSGSASAVVWNPWGDKACRMADFGDGEYGSMLCVETANAASDRRMLGPGEQHRIICRIQEKSVHGAVFSGKKTKK